MDCQPRTGRPPKRVLVSRAYGTQPCLTVSFNLWFKINDIEVAASHARIFQLAFDEDRGMLRGMGRNVSIAAAKVY